MSPFAGCATTCVAAEKLQRQWVGIDIWAQVHEIVIERLKDATGLFSDVHLTDAPPVHIDDYRYLELDHNTPRSDGGINHLSNRILLCGPCNRLKSNTLTLSGLRRENKKLGYMA